MGIDLKAIREDMEESTDAGFGIASVYPPHITELIDRVEAAEKRIADAIGFIERNATEHCCSGSDEIDVEATIAILKGEGDPRDTEHVVCDCLPRYGPPHCHLCSQSAQGHSGDWNTVALWPCTPSLA